jgi:S1-C subfamily serine protease
VPFDFVTTNDIVGGNSGSPVVNRKGEVVGLVFDGNIQSLPGYFVYDGSVNRTVSVDVRAIIAALRHVYGAGALADEMIGANRGTR